MNNMLFLYRVKDSDERDCCAYIENKNPRFECGHYFGNVILHGACYSKHEFDKYEDVETILTKEEYEELISYNEIISKLGYSIKEGDERYKAGIWASKNIQHVFDKLNSEEAKDFMNDIVKSEIEYLKDKYYLSDSDVDKIFNEYYLDYRDRGIVSTVFKNSEELGYEEAFSLGYINTNDEISQRYFDYEKFGSDLLEEESFVELDDGRIVVLNY
ncbi:MAG: hypothetical protein ACLTWK_00240 [Eisenbergiella sp.]